MDASEKMVEMPPIEVPDEIGHTETTEIGGTTPHPKPDSPLAVSGSNGTSAPTSGMKRDGKIGYL
jgi:hypothetical protein